MCAKITFKRLSLKYVTKSGDNLNHCRHTKFDLCW